MASAPPMETGTLVGYPPPPSYDEALGSNPMYPAGPYAPADQKAPVPPYPPQGYGQMYPAPPQQGQPITTPVGNGFHSPPPFFLLATSSGRYSRTLPGCVIYLPGYVYSEADNLNLWFQNLR